MVCIHFSGVQCEQKTSLLKFVSVVLRETVDDGQNRVIMCLLIGNFKINLLTTLLILEELET